MPKLQSTEKARNQVRKNISSVIYMNIVIYIEF